MKKILGIFITLIIAVGLYFYIDNYTENNNKNIIKEKTITKEEALTIIENKYGIKDEMTGNTMSYSYITIVKDKDSNSYYAFRESWLVDNSHLSFLQNIFVSYNGKSIHTSSAPDSYTKNEVVEFDE